MTGFPFGWVSRRQASQGQETDVFPGPVCTKKNGWLQMWPSAFAEPPSWIPQESRWFVAPAGQSRAERVTTDDRIASALICRVFVVRPLRQDIARAGPRFLQGPVIAQYIYFLTVNPDGGEKMYRALIIAAVTAAVSCFIAGCGGGRETTMASVTKAQFVQRADAICTKFTKERKAAIESKKNRPAGYPEAEKEAEEHLKKVGAPSLREEVEELKALTPPEKDAEQVGQMLENLEEATEDLAVEGLKAYSRPSKLADFEDEAEAYGLQVCPNP
jgi:hypothetical protein